MKYISRVAVLGAVMLIPLATSAQSASVQSLQAQVQALLQQINQIQATGGTSASGGGSAGAAYTTNAAACPNIGGTLKFGSRGGDVTRLQQFLARDPSVYPEAAITGYFGRATQVAVTRWQTKYHVVSSGSPSTTGYGMVGPRTAAAIALLCVTGSVNGINGSNAAASTAPDNTVSGYLQVTPFTGSAPLTVTVTATVNTLKSCSGAVYGLDFGDGSGVQQIAVPANSNGCATLSQTFTHIYAAGGSYRMSLSSGTHHTYALVMVSGSIANATADSLTASAVTGAAPAVITFSGVINSAASCDGGSYTLVYGDGQASQLVFPSQSCAALPFSVPHQYVNGGSFVGQLFVGNATGGAPVAQVAVVLSGAPGSASQSSGGSSTTNSNVGTYTIASLTAATSTAYAHTIVAQVLVPSCALYTLDWGDGTAPAIVPAQTSCSVNSQVTASYTHTYTQAGNYNIVLKDTGTQVRTSAYATIAVQ